MENVCRDLEPKFVLNLERREVLEALVRQGVVILSELKRECRAYERYQEAMINGCRQGGAKKTF